ncbi:MAG TPA: hypothetical protein VJM10_03925 [Candidatus Methylomirabilis sp.]|nr:hypothetical protein [Candidatus Methylomirabilis sp.]
MTDVDREPTDVLIKGNRLVTLRIGDKILAEPNPDLGWKKEGWRVVSGWLNTGLSRGKDHPVRARDDRGLNRIIVPKWIEEVKRTSESDHGDPGCCMPNHLVSPNVCVFDGLRLAKVAK